MKYNTKYPVWGIMMLACFMAACTESQEPVYEEQEQNNQNGSRTELVEKTVTLTDTEGLESQIGSERIELQKLTVNGEMDASDIEFLKNELPLLTILDLKGATLENNTIPESFFSDNNMLEEVTVPDNLVTIDANAFKNCKALKKVVMNEGLTTIYSDAFKNCVNLKEVNLPQSLVTLGNECFYMAGLDSITLGSSLKTIGRYVFSESELVYVDFKCNNVQSFGYQIFKDCEKLDSITLHEGLITIPNDFMYNCTKLKGIEFPSTVTEIGYRAFYNTGIKEVTINSGITTIRSNVFSDCKNLKKAVINSVPETWENYIFSGCTALEDVTLNNDITVIPYRTFYGCKNLKSIDLPDNIKKIEGYAFYDSGLKSIDLKNVQELGNDSFSDTDLKNVTVPESLTLMEYDVFSACDSLEYVVWKSEANIPRLYYSNSRSTLLFVDRQGGVTPAIDDEMKGRAIINNHIDSLYFDISNNSSGTVFNCPRQITYKKIVFRKDFSRAYNEITEPGKATCWKTITLPVVPTKIVTVETEAKVLAPFNTDMATDYCPFWLRRLTANGFENTVNFEAYKPFIISMPYNPNMYLPEYNVNSYVDFIAENGTLEPTPVPTAPDEGAGLRFHANYTKLNPDGLKYVLNAEDQFEGYYGSSFIRSLYDVYPFEAYITTSGNAGTNELRMDDIFGKGSKPASRTAKTRNNTGKPQIDDL